MKIFSSQAHTFLWPLLPQKLGTRQESPLSSNQRTEEQAEIEKLRKRDQEVRTHEQAHIAAAGGLAKGEATLSFQRGADGKQYAVGGEVNIATFPVSGNPEATIAQDRAVAAAENALEAQAQQELQKEEHEASASSDENVPATFSRIDLFA